MRTVLGMRYDETDEGQAASPAVGAQMAWRAWKLRDDLPSVLLSPHRKTPWPVEGLMGKCSHRDKGEPVSKRDCACDINAFDSPEQLQDAGRGYFDQRILGEVALTGEVRRFELGWRGQAGRPVRLWARRRRDAAMVQAVAEHYGATYMGLVEDPDSPWAKAGQHQWIRQACLAAFVALLIALSMLAHRLFPGMRPYEGADGHRLAVDLGLAWLSLRAMRLLLAAPCGVMRKDQLVKLALAATTIAMLLAWWLHALSAYDRAAQVRHVSAGQMASLLAASHSQVTLRPSYERFDLPADVRSDLPPHVSLPTLAGLARAVHVDTTTPPANSSTTGCSLSRGATWCWTQSTAEPPMLVVTPDPN